MPPEFNQKEMKKSAIFYCIIYNFNLRTSRINTQTPETTLEVVGKPNDISHYDGIIPPRITGNQLAAKNISIHKKEQWFMQHLLLQIW